MKQMNEWWWWWWWRWWWWRWWWRSIYSPSRSHRSALGLLPAQHYLAVIDDHDGDGELSVFVFILVCICICFCLPGGCAACPTLPLGHWWWGAHWRWWKWRYWLRKAILQSVILTFMMGTNLPFSFIVFRVFVVVFTFVVAWRAGEQYLGAMSVVCIYILMCLYLYLPLSSQVAWREGEE